MKLEQFAEEVGLVLRGGFGDRVAIGLIIGLLKNVTAKQCHDYIVKKKPLLYYATDEDWKKYARHVKGVNLDIITVEAIEDKLSKRRPDLLGTIINTPGGRQWLETSVEDLKSKFRQLTT